MKVPDKIYLEKPKGCTGNLIGYAYKENKGLYDLSPTEYVSKDALLEWANGMMDCFAPGGDCSQTLQMVIKHIESL